MLPSFIITGMSYRIISQTMEITNYESKDKSFTKAEPGESGRCLRSSKTSHTDDIWARVSIVGRVFATCNSQKHSGECKAYRSSDYLGKWSEWEGQERAGRCR